MTSARDPSPTSSGQPRASRHQIECMSQMTENDGDAIIATLRSGGTDTWRLIGTDLYELVDPNAVPEPAAGKYLSGFAVAPRGVLQRAVNAARVIRKEEKAAKAETAADQVATGEEVLPL